MKINSNDIGKYENHVVYGCAFDVAKAHSGYKYRNLLPTAGTINCLDRWTNYFIPYNNSYKLVKSKRRDTRYVEIFDNYDECVEYYKSMVQHRIDQLEEQLADLKSLLQQGEYNGFQI